MVTRRVEQNNGEKENVGKAWMRKYYMIMENNNLDERIGFIQIDMNRV